MKRFNSSILFKVCSLCIAFATVITTSDISLVLWGEPEYPVE